jgi:hypothetical protein
MPSSSRRSWNKALPILVPVATVLLCLCLVEGAIRLAIFTDVFRVEQLRNPALYADPWYDDDYWKLQFVFERQDGVTAPPRPGHVERELHPLLGWAPKVTPRNPLGIVTDVPYTLADLEPAVLFFGDSYVDGPELIPLKVPQLLDPLLERHVVNYGVSGYGVDQIYLRFLETYPKFTDPIVLIGIQDRDLDRTILSIRNRQKPVLAIEDGELAVGNTPIGDTAEYLERSPIELDSYLLRFALLRLRRVGLERPIHRWLGYDERQELKLRLNRRILEAFKSEAEKAGIHLYFVLFYVENDMLEETWREVFLKQTLQELQMPYFDTKTYLLDLLESRGGSVEDYWSNDHGHPTGEANRLFAQGIADWLRRTESELRLSSSR